MVSRRATNRARTPQNQWYERYRQGGHPGPEWVRRRATVHGRLQRDAMERRAGVGPVRPGSQDLTAQVRSSAALGFPGACGAAARAGPRAQATVATERPHFGRRALDEGLVRSSAPG